MLDVSLMLVCLELHMLAACLISRTAKLWWGSLEEGTLLNSQAE